MPHSVKFPGNESCTIQIRASADSWQLVSSFKQTPNVQKTYSRIPVGSGYQCLLENLVQAPRLFSPKVCISQVFDKGDASPDSKLGMSYEQALEVGRLPVTGSPTIPILSYPPDKPGKVPEDLLNRRRLRKIKVK